MKALFHSFLLLLRHITRDGMLLLLAIAPFLVATIFYVVAPLLPFDLSQYYLLFDLFVAIITPYLFCFASSLAILEEVDGKVSIYLTVTPIGKAGYLISRLIIPTLISTVVTAILLTLFSLTPFSGGMIVALSLSMGLLATTASLVVVVLAKNKVEGMALSKLSGLLLIGLFIPFFLTDNTQYLFSLLPSFWVSKMAITNSYLYFFPNIILSLAMMYGLFKRFDRKIR